MVVSKQVTILGFLLFGFVVFVFSAISYLQQEKTHSELIRSRLAITVEEASRPFSTITGLGLPVSMLRNRAQVLSRTHSIDNTVEDVVLINPSGIVVEYSGPENSHIVPKSILTAMRRSGRPEWTLQSNDYLVAGRTITAPSGNAAGAIYARYPLSELDRQSAEFRLFFIQISVAVFAACYALAFFAFRTAAKRNRGTLLEIEAGIKRAEDILSQAENEAAKADFDQPKLDGSKLPVMAKAIPETGFSRKVRQLTTAVYSALVLGALLVLATTAQMAISRNLEPELEKRAELVAHVLAENVATSLNSGVPAKAITGLRLFMANLRQDFPEIIGLELVLDGQVTRAGTVKVATFTQDLTLGDETQARITIGSDPSVIVKQFRALFFDLAIVAVFTLLLAVEIAILQIARSLVIPVTGLHLMIESVINREYALIFPSRWPAAYFATARSMSARIQRLRSLWPTSASVKAPLSRLQLTSLADVRLGLFLFTVADEAPLSFFALFVQDLQNPFSYLADEVAITLPFAGYLIAALLCAPLARPLGQRVGYRALFVSAALLTCVAKTGLYLSEDILIACFWQSLNGAFFVLGMLACQDFALDMLPASERVRSMAVFRAVLFSGVFAGTALGGILADRAGERPVFILCAALALISAALIYLLLPGRQSSGGHGEPVVNNDQGLSFRFLLAFRDWQFCLLAFGIIAPQAIIDHVFVSYLLALLMDDAGASITMIAQVMMVFFLSLILAGHAVGHLKAVSSNGALVAAVFTLASGAALIIAGLQASYLSLLLVSVVAGLTLGLSGGPITHIALQIAETRLTHLGTTNVLGMVRVMERGGAAAAMLSAGAFAAYFGFERTTGAIGIYTMIAATLFLMFAVSKQETPEKRT